MIENINHDRSFPSDGPTCMINGVDAVVVVVVAGTAAGVSVAPSPPSSSSPATNCSDSTPLLQQHQHQHQQQPFFDIASSSSPFTPISLKSPAGAEVAGVMAAASTLGFFPFTNAQWKELEIQATIYKYMMASVPVPPDLLLPITRNHLSHLPYPSSHSTLGRGSVLRFSNNGDPEPGRCRRTDGKKWRCARDVATPEQKYCERHMNRGRPRSRKPVELHSDFNNKNKKPRHVLHSNPPPPLVSDPPINASNNGGSGTGSISQTPYLVNHPLFDKASSGFESAVSVSTYKEPRTMDWMMKEETVPTSDQQWQHLMQQPKICTFFNQNYANFGAIQDQNNGGSSSFLNLDEMGSFEKPQTETSSRCFIDAWSNRTETEYKNGSSNNNNSKDSVSSSLTLSMASTINDDEMGHLQMGLGLIESDNDHKKTQMSNWLNTPGGPLAEVLRLTASSTATNPESSTTMSLSTSSGVLQRTTIGSNIVSDGSGNSSPTTTLVKQPKTVGFLWLNQSKLAAAASTSTSSVYERF